MNREELLYNLKYGLRFIPDKMYIQLYYFLRFKRFCHLKHPRTFNEKIQWLKLNDHNPMYCTMVDKYEAKNYVASRIGEQYIIPTLGVWDHFDDIDFSLLPDQFVLKCTHDSAGLVIVKDKSKLDIQAARRKINRSLNKNFYYIGREWQYKNIKPRVIAEAYMEDHTVHELRDYKWLCFNGEPKVLFVAANRGNGHPTIDYFDSEYRHLDLVKHYPNSEKELKKPQTFDEMIEKARILSTDMAHIRVDFYEVDGKMYFGELTFYTGSGFSPYKPEKWDELFGSWIDLSSLM